jgi:hypothetical protein
MSPADLSTVGTPDSSGNSSSMQDPQYSLQQHFSNNTGLPDLSAMMFPSADPFAYPNQPMMEYENIKHEDLGMMNDHQVFLRNGAGAIDDLEGVLYGPVPPYMNQGQPSFDLQAQTGAGNMVGGLGQDLNFHTGITPNGDVGVNMVDIFGDGGGWADQGYQ